MGCINFLNRKIFDFSIQKIYATRKKLSQVRLLCEAQNSRD
jgi:hypothetical protein